MSARGTTKSTGAKVSHETNTEPQGGSVPDSRRALNAARMRRQAAGSTFFWIFVALLALFITFTLTTPTGTFLSVFNMQSILSDSSVLLLVAASATFVIIAGGLDLSVGSVLTFAAVAAMLVIDAVGVEHGWWAIAAGMAAAMTGGTVWGVINGVLIAYLRLPAFVVTLGSLGAALGLARLLADGVAPTGGAELLQSDVGLAEIAGIPALFLIAAVVVAILGLLLAFTRFGEHIYLIGSNEEAARRGGIRVARKQLAVYSLAGFLVGFAAILEISRFNEASINTGHTNLLIAAIAAVIIGGASLNGGIGTMAGTVVGVFIPIVLSNGLVILGLQRFWQDIVVGIVLVVAVWFDRWQRERELLRNDSSSGVAVSTEAAH